MSNQKVSNDLKRSHPSISLIPRAFLTWKNGVVNLWLFVYSIFDKTYRSTCFLIFTISSNIPLFIQTVLILRKITFNFSHLISWSYQFLSANIIWLENIFKRAEKIRSFGNFPWTYKFFIEPWRMFFMLKI